MSEKRFESLNLKRKKSVRRRNVDAVSCCRNQWFAIIANTALEVPSENTRAAKSIHSGLFDRVLGMMKCAMSEKIAQFSEDKNIAKILCGNSEGPVIATNGTMISAVSGGQYA